jgi:Domain of unknown function (DUF4440)
MALSTDRRRELQKQTGLTDQQLKETVGEFTVDAASAKASGLSKVQADSTRNALRQVVTDCTLISAKYNEVATRTNQDARTVVPAKEVAADRAALESLFAEEYRFTDPNGNVGDRDKTIDAILSGRVRKEGFGRKGFLTTEETLQLHGKTAVSSGSFHMRGSGIARNLTTGAETRRSRTGTYRTTHTYVQRDGRWQLAASQMTQLPTRKTVAFVDD